MEKPQGGFKAKAEMKKFRWRGPTCPSDTHAKPARWSGSPIDRRPNWQATYTIGLCWIRAVGIPRKLARKVAWAAAMSAATCGVEAMREGQTLLLKGFNQPTACIGRATFTTAKGKDVVRAADIPRAAIGFRSGSLRRLAKAIPLGVEKSWSANSSGSQDAGQPPDSFRYGGAAVDTAFRWHRSSDLSRHMMVHSDSTCAIARLQHSDAGPGQACAKEVQRAPICMLVEEGRSGGSRTRRHSRQRGGRRAKRPKRRRGNLRLPWRIPIPGHPRGSEEPRKTGIRTPSTTTAAQCRGPIRSHLLTHCPNARLR